LINKEEEKWIKDYVDRETAVTRKRVQDAETVIMPLQEDMRNIDNARSITTKSETTYEDMLNAIGDSLSDLPSSDDEEDGEDKDGKGAIELGKLSEDGEPG